MDAKVIKIRPSDDPDLVLEEAKGSFQDVLIIGYDKDGVLDARANNLDARECLFLIEQFKLELLSGEYYEQG